MLENILTTALTVVVSALVGGAIAYFVGALKLKGRLIDLEKWRCYIQEDNDIGLNERRLLLSSVLACLKGLHELDINGPVTKGIEELETYMNDQAHKPRSFTKDK